MKLELSPKLEKLDRYASYFFGVVAGGVIITSSFIAIQHVQRHDGEAQSSTYQAARPKRFKRTPLKGVQTVVFRFTYMHGAHGNTLSYLGQLSQESSSRFPGGFKIAANYRSQSNFEPTELTLKCQNVCNLSFKLPANVIDLPYKTKSKWYTPKRNFELHAGKFVLTVEKSKLIGVSLKSEDTIYPFFQPHTFFSKETYFNASGSEVKQ